MTKASKRTVHAATRQLAVLAYLLISAQGAAAQQQALPGVAVLEAEEEEVRQYSVELIVFEYVGSAAGSTEIFEPDLPAPTAPEDEFLTGDDLPVAIDDPAGESVADGDDPESIPDDLLVELEEIPTYEQFGIVMLDLADYELTDFYEKLVQLDAYRPLMHSAWVQPTLEKEMAVPLKLRRIGNPPLRLDGTVTLYLSRFLHLVVDLALEHKQPARMTATEQRIRSYGDNRSRASSSFDPGFFQPSVFYRIQEDRIVRNNELRYFDHPKFGILAKITRVEEEQPVDVDTTGDLLPGIN